MRFPQILVLHFIIFQTCSYQQFFFIHKRWITIPLNIGFINAPLFSFSGMSYVVCPAVAVGVVIKFANRKNVSI